MLRIRRKRTDYLVIETWRVALLFMTDRGRSRRIALQILLWVLAAMLIMVFVRAGLDKFDASSGWARAFRFWQYPVWFRVLIGMLEIVAALLLVWPRTAAYGAALIIVVMLGGMGTHVFVEHRPSRVTSLRRACSTQGPLPAGLARNARHSSRARSTSCRSARIANNA